MLLFHIVFRHNFSSRLLQCSVVRKRTHNTSRESLLENMGSINLLEKACESIVNSPPSPHTHIPVSLELPKLQSSTNNLAENFCKHFGKRINVSPQHSSPPFNPFPNKPWFLRVCSASFLKTLREKEKLLVTSNFSFSHSVFYSVQELSAIFVRFKIVVCKLFQFGRV